MSGSAGDYWAKHFAETVTTIINNGGLDALQECYLARLRDEVEEDDDNGGSDDRMPTKADAERILNEARSLDDDLPPEKNIFSVRGKTLVALMLATAGSAAVMAGMYYLFSSAATLSVGAASGEAIAAASAELSASVATATPNVGGFLQCKEAV